MSKFDELKKYYKNRIEEIKAVLSQLKSSPVSTEKYFTKLKRCENEKELINACLKEERKTEAIAFAKFMGGYGGRALLSQKYEQWESLQEKREL